MTVRSGEVPGKGGEVVSVGLLAYSVLLSDPVVEVGSTGDVAFT